MPCMVNILNIFLAQGWRLEISHRAFHDFIEITIQQDLAVFNSTLLSFLIVIYSAFQKKEHWNLDILVIEYLELVAKLKRTWNLIPNLPIVQKIPENYCLYLYLYCLCALIYIYQLAKFGSLRFCSKDTFCLMY